MDGGLAALYAGVIGFAGAVIGAAVGGLASYRGARRSAEVAARALADQVAEQARNEEAHWLRQERRQAYGRVLSANASFEAAFAVLIRQDGVNDPAVILEVMSAVRNLSDVCMEVHVVGPIEVARRAVSLSQVAHERVESAIARRLIALGDTSERREADAASFDERQEAWVEAFGLFVVSVRGVFLGDVR